MSWYRDLAKFVTKIVSTEHRIDKNAQDITSLSEELKELREFTRNLAYAVHRIQERTEDRDKQLTLILENELLKLENRLSASQRRKDEEES